MLTETLEKLTKAIVEKPTQKDSEDLLQGKITPEKAFAMLTAYVKEHPCRKDSVECLDLIFQIAP
jgi:hypothetical protein